MTPRSHPDDDALLALTTGAIPPGGVLVMRLHLDHCAQCRSTVRFLEALGGAVLGATAPNPLATRAADLSPALDLAATDPAPPTEPRMPLLMTAGIGHGPWKPFLPGVVVADVDGDFESGETVCLLKGTAGSLVPEHTHEKIERFIVLEGQFGLDSTAYDVGDYIEAGAEVTHIPFIPTDCICLFALEGGLIFTKQRAKPSSV